MIILIGAFLAGTLTILSPCTLPVVPLILGASLTGRGRRLAWVLAGFVASFVAVTVVLASALAALDLTTSTARILAAGVLGLAGATLLVPRLGDVVAARIAPVADRATRLARPADASGPLQGFVLGGLIGLVWAPCVGPIMAAVIVSAAVVGPTIGGTSIALAYAMGAALAIGVVALLGQRVVRRIGPDRRAGTQRSIGLAMLLTAALVVTGLDLSIQARIADILPAGWGTALASVDGPPSSAAGPLASVTADSQEAPAVHLDDLGPAPELTGITDWINSQPLTLASLRGKVVLVHFWTFACINCLHVQPFVKAWYDRYAAEGFVVVGVHTPELSFEREIGNVRTAVQDDDVRFPVAFDPAYATWRAYENHVWPAFYFVDREGRIRHVHFGEGDYDGSEAVIQALLAEPA
jgi:cytochrome c biogenesis protein CcdA/thiol-disulfide isomerase/thioredoxin